MALPDPVDDDSGRQRVVGIGQPYGQLPTAAAGLVFGDDLSAEDLEEPSRDLGAGAFRIPFEVQQCVRRFSLGDGKGLFIGRQ